jgi:predicted HicB family RNase H-like nuclease
MGVFGRREGVEGSHRKAAIRAAAEDLSLNAWIAKQIEAA